MKCPPGRRAATLAATPTGRYLQRTKTIVP